MNNSVNGSSNWTASSLLDVSLTDGVACGESSSSTIIRRPLLLLDYTAFSELLHVIVEDTAVFFVIIEDTAISFFCFLRDA